MIRALLRQPSGLILIAGPVASGKSSTLYAMVDELNDGSRKIHTLEDPIEHSIPGVIQSQINERANLGFAELLSTVLRHSPDVIMIGEIRDARTAATAIRAGSSGQLVLATIHARSAAEAIDSMLHYGVDPKAISQALLGAISQRLVGKICPECGEKASEQSPEIDERVANRLGGKRPVASTARPPALSRPGRRARGALSRRRHPASAALDGVSPEPAPDRILARPRIPPSRPPAVCARER